MASIKIQPIWATVVFVGSMVIATTAWAQSNLFVGLTYTHGKEGVRDKSNEVVFDSVMRYGGGLRMGWDITKNWGIHAGLWLNYCTIAGTYPLGTEPLGPMAVNYTLLFTEVPILLRFNSPFEESEFSFFGEVGPLLGLMHSGSKIVRTNNGVELNQQEHLQRGYFGFSVGIGVSFQKMESPWRIEFGGIYRNYPYGYDKELRMATFSTGAQFTVAYTFRSQ